MYKGKPYRYVSRKSCAWICGGRIALSVRVYIIDWGVYEVRPILSLAAALRSWCYPAAFSPAESAPNSILRIIVVWSMTAIPVMIKCSFVFLLKRCCGALLSKVNDSEELQSVDGATTCTQTLREVKIMLVDDEVATDTMGGLVWSPNTQNHWTFPNGQIISPAKVSWYHKPSWRASGSLYTPHYVFNIFLIREGPPQCITVCDVVQGTCHI